MTANRRKLYKLRMTRLRTVFAAFLLLVGLVAVNQNLLTKNLTGDFTERPVSEATLNLDFCHFEKGAVLPSPLLAKSTTESIPCPPGESSFNRNFNSSLFFIPASALLAQTGQPPRAG